MAYNERNLVEVVPDYDLNIESSGEDDIAEHNKRHQRLFEDDDCEG